MLLFRMKVAVSAFVVTVPSKTQSETELPPRSQPTNPAHLVVSAPEMLPLNRQPVSDTFDAVATKPPWVPSPETPERISTELTQLTMEQEPETSPARPAAYLYAVLTEPAVRRFRISAVPI